MIFKCRVQLELNEVPVSAIALTGPDSPDADPAWVFRVPDVKLISVDRIVIVPFRTPMVEIGLLMEGGYAVGYDCDIPRDED
jgi:hypothetical protein